jgi:hypothetical protein
MDLSDGPTSSHIQDSRHMDCRDQLRIVCRVAILTFFALFADRVMAQSAGLTGVTLPKEIQGEWRASSALKSLEER